jgi:hypothetical protein
LQGGRPLDSRFECCGKRDENQALGAWFKVNFSAIFAEIREKDHRMKNIIDDHVLRCGRVGGEKYHPLIRNFSVVCLSVQ